jgi:DNA-binding response OmpR family regulator
MATSSNELPESAGRATSNPPAVDDQRREAPRVLVISPAPPVLEALATLLALDGCDVRVAAPASGTRLEEDWPLDLILVDADWPGQSVPEVIRVIQDGCDARLPTVIISDRPMAAAQAAALGAVGALPKPFDLAELFALVHRCCPRPGRRTESPDPSAPVGRLIRAAATRPASW